MNVFRSENSRFNRCKPDNIWPMKRLASVCLIKGYDSALSVIENSIDLVWILKLMHCVNAHVKTFPETSCPSPENSGHGGGGPPCPCVYQDVYYMSHGEVLILHTSAAAHWRCGTHSCQWLHAVPLIYPDVSISSITSGPVSPMQNIPLYPQRQFRQTIQLDASHLSLFLSHARALKGVKCVHDNLCGCCSR